MLLAPRQKRRGSQLSSPALSHRGQSEPSEDETPQTRAGLRGVSSQRGSPAPSRRDQSESELLLAGDAFDSEDWEDHSESGSDFQLPISRKSRKRRAAETPRQTPSSKRSRGGAAEVTRAPPRSDVSAATRPGRSEVTARDLFDAVKTGKSAMLAVVDDWLDSYKQDREAGLLQLFNFIVQCSGCRGVVSLEMLQNLQYAQIISQLTREFDEDSSEYPLSRGGVQWRRFSAGFCELVSALVQRGQYSVVFDEFLMDSTISLLTGLSDSQVRAFRHTSTLAAMKLMTALVDVSLGLASRMETNRRQYESECSKELSKRASERLEELREKRRELQEQQEEIESMMNAVFKGVFVHRYRDSVAEIRGACMQEMGVWMRKHSESFLNDGYLKYLGWTLHDKQGSVRLKCLKALQGLYSNKENTPKLELFTNRFKDRILCMVLDKEFDVSVEAVRLLVLIQQNAEEVLSAEDCTRVYPLVYASHRGVARAAGQFVYHKLVSEGELRKGLGPPRTALIRLLVSFYIESDLHEHAAYLVDSLWDSAGTLLRDWERITELLLEGAEGEEEGFSDREESALIEILVCSMRQAAEVHPPVGRTGAKRVLSVKDRKTQLQDRTKLTEHFIVVLPQLLAKYSADVEKVSNLLQAPHYFNLEIYCTGRLEKYLELLLSQVSEVCVKHTHVDVLEACSRVFSVLSSEELPFAGRVEISLSRLLEGLQERLSQDLEELLQGNLDEDDVYNTAATLKRIAAFHNAKDLTRWGLFEPCYRILSTGVETGDIPEEIMVPALKCAYLHALWELSKASNSHPSQAELAQLKQHVQSLSAVCHSCLSDLKEGVREQAFMLLCDLLVICSPAMVRGGRDYLKPVVLRPSLSLRSELAGFVIDFVFVEPDEGAADEEDGGDSLQLSLLHRRRGFLAGFCKLLVYNVLELDAAADVFKHFLKFYKDYGDIIKETLSRARQIDKMQCAKTLCLSLQQLFSELVQETGLVFLRSSPLFSRIRDLARRLALTFGVDLIRIREPLVTLHKEGIRFAFHGEEQPPQNLLFLEVLSEFSSKLLRQDKRVLADHLERVSGQPCSGPPWSPLRMYQRSLLAADRSDWESASGVSRVSRATRTPRQGTPARKRRRKSTPGSTPSPAQGRGTSLRGNQLTSTLVRGTRRPLLGAGSASEGSEADFIESQSVRSERQGVRPPAPSPSPPSRQELGSQLQHLTLIEEDEDQDEEEEIEEFDSSEESESSPLPSTRPVAGDLLQDLFDSTILNIEGD
ncbi:cohesin subunit SA-1-like [Acipenser ruthenus]|uniref:cohesin subunit SA-1-like n=1 Tax=Acipenser ruthenus TaxID=7906 RepID=UPI002742875D|nr:cohesin subunit SA-1-like [Acipenser ruthenus]